MGRLKLTDYQRKILTEMRDRGAVIQTTEGKDYKVWLYYPNGETKGIRKDTANLLFLGGYITLNEESVGYYYEYKYTGKKIV